MMKGKQLPIAMNSREVILGEGKGKGVCVNHGGGTGLYLWE